MRLFLSYASKDRSIADDVHLALVGQGHEVFFDQPSLIPGDNFESRIHAAMQSADAIIFLISPSSVAKGSYALTELNYARRKWPHPEGHVLPAMIEATPFEKIPAYLRAVTILQPEGNTAAEITDTIRRWHERRSPTPPDQSPIVHRVTSVFSVFLGGLLIATALGTLFSHMYPRVGVDTNLALLLVLISIPAAFGIRWIWRRIMRVRQ